MTLQKNLTVASIMTVALLISACSDEKPRSVYETQSSNIEANALEAERAETEVAEAKRQKVAGQKEEGSSRAKKRNPASSKAGSPANSASYIVQIGAFREKENAEKFLQKMKNDGRPVIMKELNHSKNGDMFVVRYETTSNKSEAEQWASDFKTKMSMDAQIISLSR